MQGEYKSEVEQRMTKLRDEKKIHRSSNIF